MCDTLGWFRAAHFYRTIAVQDMIQVRVKLFGPAADAVGCSELEYALTPPATLAGLLELMSAKYPALGGRATSLRFAVNEAYAEPGAPLADGDEVAVIPPVSGGDWDPVVLTTDPIDTPALARLVADRSCGAVVTFQGVVRAEGPPANPLLALEYSAYEPMALRQMILIREQALEKFAIWEAALAHRLGRLAVGETSVAVVVAAPHRGDAFTACRWIIDTLKLDVPIWKKEVWTQGEATWADPETSSKSQ